MEFESDSVQGDARRYRSRSTLLSKISRLVASICIAAAACIDSTSPTSEARLIGRYVVVSVDGKPLPGFVSASVANPAFGYDSAWMEADTLLLKSDRTAEETALFSYKQRRADETDATSGTETVTVAGSYSSSDGRLTVKTWMDLEDTVSVLEGGKRLQRATMTWSYRPTRRKPVLVYERQN